MKKLILVLILLFLFAFSATAKNRFIMFKTGLFINLDQIRYVQERCDVTFSRPSLLIHYGGKFGRIDKMYKNSEICFKEYINFITLLNVKNLTDSLQDKQ